MLGRTLLELNRPQEAEADAATTRWTEWSKEYGATSAWYSLARAFLGTGMGNAGPFRGSRARTARKLPAAGARRGLTSTTTASVRRWIEDLYRSTGRPQQAQAYFQQVEAQERAARNP